MAIGWRSWPSRVPVCPPKRRSTGASASSAPISTGASLAPFRGDAVAIGSGCRVRSVSTPTRPSFRRAGRGVVERLRAPLRRAAEILAYRQRVRPWAAAVVAAVPADVYSAKALVALPVVREAAHRAGGRFVYDIADLHVESGRLAHMPGLFKSYLSRRERRWMADAAGLIAVTDPLADEVVRRFGVPRPTVVMNCRPRWRPDEPGLPASDRLRDAIAATVGAIPGRPADPPVPGGLSRRPGDRGVARRAPLEGRFATRRWSPCSSGSDGSSRVSGRSRRATPGESSCCRRSRRVSSSSGRPARRSRSSAHRRRRSTCG